MGFFSRRREQAAQSELQQKLDGRAIRYAARRTLDKNGSPVEIILGKNGAINAKNGVIIVMCNAKEVFRCDAETAECSELMSLNGAVIKGINAATGEPETVVAYYTKF